MTHIDYRGLAALDAIIGHGSFDKASVALSISQSAVSQRIRALEEHWGMLLIVRSQPPQLTEFGQRLVAHYRQVKLLEVALDKTAEDALHLPEVAIAVNADSVATWFPRSLGGLLAEPACVFHISIDDQDYTLNQLREGRVFACVTSATELVAGTTMTSLGVMRYLCVASPAFAARWFKDGFTAEAVRQAPALVYDRKDTLHSRYLSHQLGMTGRFPSHTLGASEAFVRFVEAGFAYGVMPLLQAQAGLAAGRLIDVTPGNGLDVPLAWHAWSIDTPLTRAISESVVATARKSLLPSC